MTKTKKNKEMAEGEEFILRLNLNNMSADIERAGNMFRSLENKAVESGNRIDRTFSETSQNIQNEAEGMNTSMTKIGAAIGGAFAAAQIVEFGKKIVEVRSRMEAYQTSFNTLLGSEEKGTEMFKALNDFAIHTPLMLGDIASGAQTMMGFNIEAEKVLPTLKEIGDISMGDSDRFRSLTLAFSQMSATGHLMGQDLLQMINAGFNPLSVMSEKTGKSISQLKDEMSAGAISSEMVAKAFADATAEGGKFHGMMNSLSKTTKGAMSNLRGAIENAFDAIGEKSQPIITGGVSLATEAVRNYDKLGKVILSLIAIYGSYKAAVMVVTATEAIRYQATLAHMAGYTTMGAITDVLKAKVAALNTTMLANPYVAATVALVALTAAIIAYSKGCTAAEEETKRLNDRTDEQNTSLQKRTDLIQKNIAALSDENKSDSEKRKILNELKAMMPSVFGQYLTWQDLVNQQTKAQRALNGELEREKNIQGKGNISSDTKRLEELRRLQSYYNKDKTGSGGSLSKSELEDFKTLNPKYASQMNAARGTGQSSSSVLKRMIEETVNSINKESNSARETAMADFNSRLQDTNQQQANNMIANYTRWLTQAQNQGKKWITLPGDTFPTAVAEVERRLSEAKKRVVNIQKNASVDFLKESKSEYNAAQKDLQNVVKNRNDRSLYPDASAYSAAYKKAQDAVKAAKTKYESMGGSTSEDSKASKSAEKEQSKAEKAAEKANEIRAKQLEEEKKAAELKKSIDQETLQARYDIQQKEINMRAEGFDKESRQIALNFEKTKSDIAAKKESWIKDLQDMSDAQFESNNPNWKKEGKTPPTMSESNLSDSQKSALEAMYKAAEDEQQNATAKLYDTLLKKYQNYEMQRNAIAKQYADDRKSIEGDSSLTDSQKTAYLTENLKQEKQAIKEVNDAELQASEANSTFFSSLFGDVTEYSTKQIENMLAKTKRLYEYLTGVKDASGNVQVGAKTISGNDIQSMTGMSQDQLSTLSKDPEKLKAIQKALIQLKEEATKSNPFKELGDAIAEMFKKGDEKALETKIKNIGNAASESASMVGNLASNLSSAFKEAGNDSAAQAAEDVGSVATSVGNIASGFAKGGIVGGIAAAAGEAISWAGKAAAAEARHKAALLKIQQDIVAQQREYNIELLKEELEAKDAETVFGTDKYTKANAAISVLKQSTDQLTSSLKDLSSIDIVTGHQKTGLFGWGAGKDTYSSILSVYPELIDESGKFNATLAETIMDTRTMSDTDKAALQNLINIYQEQEAALEEVKSYLENIFGELGNTMSDALVSAFENGTSAAGKFSDSISNMVEELAKEMAYSVTIQPLVEKAQEQMISTMENGSLTDEAKFNNYVSILSNLMDGVIAQQDNENALLQEMKDTAAEKGIDIFNTSSRTGSSSSSLSATQDSVDELSGRATVIQSHTYTIANSMPMLIENGKKALEHLSGIETNTGLSKSRLDEMDSKLNLMRRAMDDINQKGITLRK